MTELLLVRHGESTRNVAGRMHSQTASPALTDCGRRQSVEAGAQLLAGGTARLLTSDVIRARQTAAIIGMTQGLDRDPTRCCASVTRCPTCQPASEALIVRPLAGPARLERAARIPLYCVESRRTGASARIGRNRSSPCRRMSEPRTGKRLDRNTSRVPEQGVAGFNPEPTHVSPTA